MAIIKQFLLILFWGLISPIAFPQTNFVITNPVAEQILQGNYNPANYFPSEIINGQDEIICGLQDEINTDSLHSYLVKLSSFHNRNTGSDTISATTGIGAARRWAFSKFQEFSAANENRLIPSYFQFDQIICASSQHRNIFGVLPGIDTTNHSLVIIEAHIDSRCEGLCDTVCQAHGMEDNGSGSALALELARVMSKYTFQKTIVFMLLIGEEQGLYGAEAFAQYSKNNNLKIKVVQNNDIVGGIICGKTSSPPSCSYENYIDSTQVRIFSNSAFSLQHRGFARFIKMIYEEKLFPVAPVPMLISVMNQEDRSGRGGDHQPFRQHGFTSLRFTSANEHGDADVSDTSYTDRQHTSSDLLGTDTDGDSEIDSFFVDFNYLKRNAVINGLSATMAAIGPETPDFQLMDDSTGLIVKITTQTQYQQYRVGVRKSSSVYFEAVYRFSDTLQFRIPGLQTGITYLASVASVDSNGITSIFSREYFAVPDVNTDSAVTDDFPYSLNCSLLNTETIPGNFKKSPVELLPCKPNPFSNFTIITVKVNENIPHSKAFILIADGRGNEISQLPVTLHPGMNEVRYKHDSDISGIYTYTLMIDGKPLQSRKMIFAN